MEDEIEKAARAAGIRDVSDLVMMRDTEGSAAEQVAAFQRQKPWLFAKAFDARTATQAEVDAKLRELSAAERAKQAVKSQAALMAGLQRKYAVK